MKIGIIGDLAFTGITRDEPDKNGIRFNEISNLLKGFDFIFANLEAPINKGYPVNKLKNITLFSNYSVTKDLLLKLNIKCVSLANNHILDFGIEGVKTTIKLLDEMNIKHTGAGWKKEHIEPIIFNLKSHSIAFLSFVDEKTNPGTKSPDELLINNYSFDNVKKNIDSVRGIVDFIIVSIHWGNDYSFYPTKNQINEARELIEAGVSIIMGHHPHTVQPFEVFNNRYIFYSLGGLTFGDFYLKGKLRALRKKTKKSFIPVFNDNFMLEEVIPIKELPGNYVKIDYGRDYYKWSKKKMKLSFFYSKNKLNKSLLKFQENILERFVEFNFGYYRSPKDIFNIQNFKKVKKILKG